MDNEKLNVFGEPDDIKMALYASWADAEDAACILQRVMARHRHSPELLAELHEVLARLDQCGESVESFAPNYYRKTIQNWAEAAAEANHP